MPNLANTADDGLRVDSLTTMPGLEYSAMFCADGEQYGEPLAKQRGQMVSVLEDTADYNSEEDPSIESDTDEELLAQISPQSMSSRRLSNSSLVEKSGEGVSVAAKEALTRRRRLLAQLLDPVKFEAERHAAAEALSIMLMDELPHCYSQALRQEGNDESETEIARLIGNATLLELVQTGLASPDAMVRQLTLSTLVSSEAQKYSATVRVAVQRAGFDPDPQVRTFALKEAVKNREVIADMRQKIKRDAASGGRNKEPGYSLARKPANSKIRGPVTIAMYSQHT